MITPHGAKGAPTTEGTDMDKLNTLSALVQLAELNHLPGPQEIRMNKHSSSGYPILGIALDSHDDAIAWCKVFGADWRLNEVSNEIWDSGRVVTWRGWHLQVHSRTGA